MEVVNAPEWKRPLPEPDAVTRPFWEAAAQGRLLYQRCSACGHRQFYPRAICTACGATPEWAESSGQGTVHTFTVVRQYGAPPFSNELPYVVAMIELEEGVRMMGQVTGCPVDEVRVGMPVQAYAVRADEAIGVVFWRKA
jgi:hypothetical protein